MRKHLLCLPLLALLSACAHKTLPPGNPPAPGFNAAASDAKAVAIADATMAAMGGRKAWDDTRYLSWNFFGARRHVWDKHQGRCRIEWLKRPWKVLLNLHDGKGQVMLNGVAQTHPDTLAKYLEFGRRAWINDSYWLFMPFKLKDSGVTLRYVGQGNTEAGQASDILQLTFAGVGVTPDNKYHVWVDKKTHLVAQWAYFKNYADEKPEFTTPWADYRRYGALLLSGDRGRSEGNLTEIAAPATLPDATFETF